MPASCNLSAKARGNRKKMCKFVPENDKTMRVLIVNTSEMKGGAAIAANRLTVALINNGVKAKMLVMHKDSASIYVASCGDGLRGRWHFLRERLGIFLANRLSRRNLFAVDTASSGTDITRTREFQEADVIHLHWVNQGFLSLGSLRKILQSGKPVVWTMHDMWPATAVCHLTLGCEKFKTACSQCPYMAPSFFDVAARVWKKKRALLEGSRIAFVTCSQWLQDEARSSRLLEGLRVESIPNAIDEHVFCKANRKEARRRLGLPQGKRLLLFAAQRATNGNKGIAYLAEACRSLVKKSPDVAADIELVVMGGQSAAVESEFGLPVHSLGYVSDTRTIVDAYNAADTFVLPSLSENLPNTIMEAMACGVPCVGFRVGGIPEMIDHRQNGYVAEYKSADDLMNGIRWVLSEADAEALSSAAVHKVRSHYSQQSVAKKYLDIYNNVAKPKPLIRRND